MTLHDDVQARLKLKIHRDFEQAILNNEKFKKADFTLLGEASHGTHDFYAIRASLTKELITNHGYRSLILEADWPDMYRVNRYVRHTSEDSSADEALTDFQRFPTWMWRNEEFAELIEWIRAYNKDKIAAEQVGVYGMDLYSMERSISTVIETISHHFPDLELMAKSYYGCFDHNVVDPQLYGQAAWLGEGNCEAEAVRVLQELQSRRQDKLLKVTLPDEDEFSLEQNARVVANSEYYYRSMFQPSAISWNVRDEHMVDSVKAISEFRQQLTGSARSVIWAHNSHLGDASVTDMGSRGEVNVGQLMRESFGDRVFNLGFTTATGQVVAARNWGDPAFIRNVRPPLSGSIEEFLSQLEETSFVLFTGDSETAKLLPDRSLERAIGVIYRPETERWSHYFYADVSKQFDAICHIDKTMALRPLDPLTEQRRDAEMESYPSGL